MHSRLLRPTHTYTLCDPNGLEIPLDDEPGECPHSVHIHPFAQVRLLFPPFPSRQCASVAIAIASDKGETPHDKPPGGAIEATRGMLPSELPRA